MSEIEKLRLRLKNVPRNVAEYKMSIKEAKALLEEIDQLPKPPTPVKQEVSNIDPVPLKRNLDGGSFSF